MRTIKAGCILYNKKNKTVALVHREKQMDYSFPKGHLENGETIEECAIRETAEETKRIAKIINRFKPIEEKYTTSSGEKCICYMYIAEDMGQSNNTSTDTHSTLWIPFLEVEKFLSYNSLKTLWKSIKLDIQKILETTIS